MSAADLVLTDQGKSDVLWKGRFDLFVLVCIAARTRQWAGSQLLAAKEVQQCIGCILLEVSLIPHAFDSLGHSQSAIQSYLKMYIAKNYMYNLHEYLYFYIIFFILYFHKLNVWDVLLAASICHHILPPPMNESSLLLSMADLRTWVGSFYLAQDLELILEFLLFLMVALKTSQAPSSSLESALSLSWEVLVDL